MISNRKINKSGSDAIKNAPLFFLSRALKDRMAEDVRNRNASDPSNQSVFFS
jgi:hypothetical protein